MADPRAAGPGTEAATSEPQGRIQTYYAALWHYNEPIRRSALRASVGKMRERLEEEGCALKYAKPAAPVPRRVLDMSSSSSDDEGAAVPDPFALQGWDLVERLGWRLRSEGVVDEGAIREVLANLSGAARRDFRAFVGAREAELATDPCASAKSRALRLQFVLLGRVWFANLRETPTLADYLEGEAQPVNVGHLLGF